MHENAGQEASQYRVRLNLWREPQVNFVDYEMRGHGFLLAGC
jgi:hypothetical protein